MWGVSILSRLHLLYKSGQRYWQQIHVVLQILALAHWVIFWYDLNLFCISFVTFKQFWCHLIYTGNRILKPLFFVWSDFVYESVAPILQLDAVQRGVWRAVHGNKRTRRNKRRGSFHGTHQRNYALLSLPGSALRFNTSSLGGHRKKGELTLRNYPSF